MVENGDVAAWISMVSVVEVMQGPMKKGYLQTALQVKDYLLNFPNMVCEDVTGEILDHIGKDQSIKWDKLRIVDSLIIASALKNKVDIIISNDAHFRQAIPKDFLISFKEN
jgi:predicted nucleic acid-binding protein